MDAVVGDVEAHDHVKREEVEAEILYDVPNGGEMVSRMSMFAMTDLKMRRKHHIEMRCP